MSALLSSDSGNGSMTFREMLLAEIESQKALIERMDFCRNPDYWGTGIMTQIRAEKLELLERLLEFYTHLSVPDSTTEQSK